MDKMVNPLTALPRWLAFGVALPLVVLNGWVLLVLLDYFEPITAQVVTALLLSFGLSYPVSFLQQLKIPRGRAVLLVLLLTIALLFLLGITLVPALIGQANELTTRLPTWVDSGNQQLQALQTWAIINRVPVDVGELVAQLEEWLSAQVQTVSGTALNVLVDTIGSALNLLLTIVLTFYLLLHGERLWNGIFQWFPPQVGTQVRKAFRRNFRNYFIGQITLALMMGAAMTVAFVVIQVPFGLLFGLGVGVMTLFPFGAPLGIAIVSILTALKSIWLGLRVLAITAIIDQLIESGVAPQLIGGFTGLNPVWILVSLLIGAKVGGLLGLIVAVPLASSIKSIVDTFYSPALLTSAETVESAANIVAS